jgi:hypothetical protein
MSPSQAWARAWAQHTVAPPPTRPLSPLLRRGSGCCGCQRLPSKPTLADALAPLLWAIVGPACVVLHGGATASSPHQVTDAHFPCGTRVPRFARPLPVTCSSCGGAYLAYSCVRDTPGGVHHSAPVRACGPCASNIRSLAAAAPRSCCACRRLRVHACTVARWRYCAAISSALCGFHQQLILCGRDPRPMRSATPLRRGGRRPGCAKGALT